MLLDNCAQIYFHGCGTNVYRAPVRLAPARTIGDSLMRKMLPVLLSAALLAPISAAHAQQAQSQKPLDIYFLDTEGGQATLFVSPSGQSMLVDTGFPGNQGMPPEVANTPGVTRDADRIMAVLKTANISVLDY